MLLPRFLPCFVAVLLVASAGRGEDRAAPTRAATVQIENDVVFRKVDGKELKLDIAWPKQGHGPFPAVVCVHGGAWRLGSRKELHGWIEYLAEKGFVAASCSYRLVPEGKWPAPIEDVKTAVRFLRAHAREYSVNPDKVGALGYSAGGHLVCLLGTTGKRDGFDGPDYPEQSSQVQAVVSFFGPTDLCFWGSDESAQNAVFQPMLGCRFKDNPEAYEKASPICYACKEAAPFLLFHGTADRLVPIEQSRKLAARLNDVGASARLIEVPGADHGWDGTDRRMTTNELIKFFAEHLKK